MAVVGGFGMAVVGGFGMMVVVAVLFLAARGYGLEWGGVGLGMMANMIVRLDRSFGGGTRCPYIQQPGQQR